MSPISPIAKYSWNKMLEMHVNYFFNRNLHQNFTFVSHLLSIKILSLLKFFESHLKDIFIFLEKTLAGWQQIGPAVPPDLQDILRLSRFPGPENFQLHREGWSFQRVQVRRVQIQQKGLLHFLYFQFTRVLQ